MQSFYQYLNTYLLHYQKESLLLNLGSGTGYSVKEVVDASERLFSFKWEYAPRREGDPAKLIADIRRAREQLGWEPRLGLESVLQSDYNYRKNIPALSSDILKSRAE